MFRNINIYSIYVSFQPKIKNWYFFERTALNICTDRY